MRKIIVSVCFLISFVLSGCVIQPVSPAAGTGSAEMESTANAAESVPGGYTIKALDPLYIRFSGVAEQQSLEVVVDENGEISLLHINEPIMAAGLTTSELETRIERLYMDGGIYKNVSVNVTMTAKVYYVQGEVNQPGQFPLQSGTTLLQAIASARGYTAFAWKTKVTISRHGKVYKFNMKELEKDPSNDVIIEAGDVIKVPQHWY